MTSTILPSVTQDGDWADLLPDVILANPQMGENIGASARAMKNCGLSHLHLINPRDGWPNPAAEAMASAGSEILARATVHETTATAVAPYSLIAATTARKRDMAKEILTPRDAATRLYEHAKAGGKTALLFGGERSGLANEDVALADIIITVPLNPEYSSLNLGQAVLLTGWECRMAAMEISGAMPEETPITSDPLATSAEKQYFFRTLEDEIAKGGFFQNPGMQPAVMRNIMAMFGRAQLTDQDIRTLHGILRAVKRSAKES